MKHLYKRGLSLAISIAVVITCIQIAFNAGATSITKITDDFESTLNWTQTDAKTATVTPIVDIGSNKVFIPLDSTSTTRGDLADAIIYTNNGFPSGRRMTSVTGKIKTTTISASSKQQGLSIIYYYKDANNWRGICFTGKTGTQTIRFFGMEDGVKNHFAYFSSYLSGTLTSIDGLVNTFVITYDENGGAKMTLSNSTGVSDPIVLLTGTKSFAGNEFKKSIDAGTGQFALGNCVASNANNDYFDDITINFEYTAQDNADLFKIKYATLLAKDVNDITNADTETLDQAVAEYEGFKADAKALLTAEYAKLASFGKKIYGAEFNVPTFTEKFDGKLYWSQVGFAKGIKDPIIDGAFLPNESENADQGKISLYTHTYWPEGRVLESVTGKYNIAKQYAASSMLVYYYKDSNNWRGLYVQRGGALNFFYIMKESDPNNPTKVYYKKAVAFDSQPAWKNGEIPAGETTIDFTLTYTNENKISLNFVQDEKELTNPVILSDAFVSKDTNTFLSTDGGETFSAYSSVEAGLKAGQHKFAALTDVQSTQIGFGHGQGNSTFDDITVTFTKSTDEIVKEYKAKHSAILQKQVADVTSADSEAIINAFVDLADLNAEALTALATEKAHIIDLAAKIDPNCKTFVTKYSTLLEKQKDDVTAYDEEPLRTALAEFDTLSEIAKRLLAGEKAKLEKLLSVAVNKFFPRAEDDFSDYVADFEGGKLPLTGIYEFGATSTAEIVVDPTDPTGTNHVFKMQATNNDNLLFVPCAELWNKQAQMKSIKFRQYVKSINAFCLPYLVYDYVDKETMQSVAFGGTGGVVLRDTKFGIENQKILKAAPFFNGPVNGEGNGWVEWTYTFKGNKCTVVVELPDTTTASFSLDYTAGATFALNTYSAYKFVGSEIYYDDIVVTMEKGDFDVNDDIQNINVYYSENSFIHPNETALISGEKLGIIVDKVEMMQLEDKTITNSDKAGYIFETRYDKEMGATAYSTPVAATWDQSKAKEIEILQATTNSIKAVIPKEYTNGIYVVKLTPKSYLESPVYLYLNNPEIQSTSGDEGDIATQGGWLRIIGNNMAPEGNGPKATVQLKNQSGQTFNLPVTKYYDDDSYSLEVAIPKDFQKDTYEVFVHNGYGDNTAWTCPGTIKIADSPRASWPKEVFNVKDFGAIGDADKNDTPAIVKALSAAADNGGGVVYFPKGSYRLISTIAIPRNVVFQGDGVGATSLMWTAEHWQYGKLPPLMTIAGEVQISDMGIYSARSGSNIQMAFSSPSVTYYQDGADNIYIDNIVMRCYWAEGYLTQGGGSALQGTGKVTIAELLSIVAKETTAAKISIGAQASKNLQITNLDIDVYPGTSASGLMVTHDYTRVSDCYLECGWSVFGACETLIYENNESKCSCIGANGSHVYFARNYMHSTMTNNRELFTTDGQPFAKDIRIQFIGDKEEIMGKGKTDQVTYRFTQNTYKANAIVGYMITVESGQGMGQSRKVIANSGDTFTIDSPFTVSPNRNSQIWITQPRNGWIFVDNDFREGQACGVSGAMVGIVFDGNHFDLHSGQLFSLRESPNYYITLVNEVYERPWYMHGEGYGSDCSINTTSRIRLYMMNCVCSENVIGFTIRNNQLGGYYIQINRAGYINGFRDFIVEGNTMSDVDYAIESNDPYAIYFDGVLIRNNDFDTHNQQMFTGAAFENAGNDINNIGYARAMVIQSDYVPSLIGDVNGDGKVTIKDSTYIRYYVIEMFNLSDEQIFRADVNKDGKVTLKDANQIRKFVLFGTEFSNGETSSEESSSDPSSSEESSSAPSSSQESSSTGGKDISTNMSSTDWGSVPAEDN